jgi:hypothetical protein
MQAVFRQSARAFASRTTSSAVASSSRLAFAPRRGYADDAAAAKDGAPAADGAEPAPAQSELEKKLAAKEAEAVDLTVRRGAV